MSRIQTNTASLRGIRSLAANNKTLNTSLTRLTTGLKINAGQDNPAGLIASETLRSQIAAIEQSISNNTRAGNVIATADAALGEVNSLLIQVRSLVQEGLNDGAISTDEIEANQLQIDSALAAINRISSNTTFGGDKLLDGSKGFVTEVDGADVAKLSDFRISEATFGKQTEIDVNARVAEEAEQAKLVYNGSFLSGDTTIEVGGARGNELLFLGEEATVEDIASAVNGVADATGVSARVQEKGINQAKILDIGGSAANRILIQESRVSDLDVIFDLDTDNTAGFTNSIDVDTSTAGQVTITASVGTNGGATTLQDLVDLVNNDSEASRYVDASVALGAGGTAVAVGDATAAQGLESTNNQAVVLGGENVSFGFASDTVINLTFADGAAGVAIANGATAGELDVTITNDFANGITVEDLVSQIEGDAELSKLVFVASDDDGAGEINGVPTAIASDDTGYAASTDKVFGELQLYSNAYGSDEYVSVSTLSGSFSTVDTSNASATRDEGKDIVAYINGQQAQARGLRASIKTSTLDASITFDKDANELNESANIKITGGGATFQIGQQVSTTGQIGIGIEAVNTARLGGASGKLFELTSTGGKSLLDVDTNNPGSVLVDIVEEAINEVSVLRGRLGALQKNVIETTTTSLGVALENISESRSRIIDTDFAQETAALTRAQILTQAGYSSLQIANQNPQQVLSLLG